MHVPNNNIVIWQPSMDSSDNSPLLHQISASSSSFPPMMMNVCIVTTFTFSFLLYPHIHTYIHTYIYIYIYIYIHLVYPAWDNDDSEAPSAQPNHYEKLISVEFQSYLRIWFWQFKHFSPFQRRFVITNTYCTFINTFIHTYILYIHVLECIHALLIKLSQPNEYTYYY